MEEFNYILEYHKGTLNIPADYLSREIRNKEIEKENQNIPQAHLRKIDYKEETLKEKIKQEHLKLGHPGITQTYYTLKSEIKDKQLKPTIIKVNKECTTCWVNKTNNLKYGLTHRSIKGDKPWKDISIDIYGPIPEKLFKGSTLEKIYLLTLTDIFTRWSEVYPLNNLTSTHIGKIILNNWCIKHPAPETILSDQGRQFISREFKDSMGQKGIICKFTTPYNPTGNSISERINRTIGEIIRCYRGNKLSTILKIINTGLQKCYHKAIKTTPEKLIQNDIDKEQLKAIKRHQEQLQKKNELIGNMKRKPYQFKIKETVCVRINPNSKFDPKQESPYQIKKIENNKNVVHLTSPH